MKPVVALLASLSMLVAAAPSRAAAPPPPPPARGGPGPMGPDQAGPHGPHGAMGPGRDHPQAPALDALLGPGAGIPPPVARALGLSDELVKKIRDAAFAANEEVIGLEANLKRAQLALDRALAADSPEEKQVLDKLDAVGKAELAVRKNRMKLLLQVRRTLGPELWQKLQAREPDFDVGGQEGRVVRLAVGSQVTLEAPDLARVAVGDPSIADVRVERDRIFVKATSAGRTTVLTWAKDGTRREHLIDAYSAKP